MNIKKLISTLALGAVLSASAVYAQKQPMKTAPKKPAAHAMQSHKTTPVKHVRKDGKPDMRFKENKAAKGPMKKNGTPDMRFKANKNHKMAPKKMATTAPKKGMTAPKKASH